MEHPAQLEPSLIVLDWKSKQTALIATLARSAQELVTLQAQVIYATLDFFAELNQLLLHSNPVPNMHIALKEYLFQQIVFLENITASLEKL